MSKPKRRPAVDRIGPDSPALRRSALLLTATLSLLVPLGGTAKPLPPAVDYSLSPELVGGVLKALKVEVRFRADEDGTTEFVWVDHWAGDRALSRWARDFTVAGARSVQAQGGGRWRIGSAPGAALIVRYRVISAYDHDPTVDDSTQSKPVVRPHWFYAVGEALFGRPEEHDDAPATFAWVGAPRGFGFASDLEHLAGPDRLTRRPGSLGEVLNSVVIGGRDLQVAGSLTGTSNVRVATVGHFAFSAADLDAMARRVIGMERRFWGEDNSKPFLVTAIPIKSLPARMSLSGTGRGDAFALWIDESAPLKMIRVMLAHEYFHTWNPAALGGADHTSERVQTNYWFSEGFTDYYARALAIRSGLVTPDAFAAAWNEMLLAYAASPVRAEPNARADADFWKDDVSSMLSYQRGAMLAAIWNARLRAISGGRNGLDDVLRAQKAAQREGGSGAAISFASLARRFGLEIAPDVARYLDRGEPITLPADVFGPCAEVVSETRPVYDRGFDGEATARNGMVVAGVDPSSKGYLAGLRNGMKLLAREAGEPGDSLAPYALRVEDQGRQRAIRYLPQGAATLAVQQVRLTPKRGPGCKATLSGLGPGESRRQGAGVHDSALEP